MALNISFWILAFFSIVAALAVVGLQNIFRAALALITCFLTVAGLYILLSAEFIAIVQILIYVGAISVIIILAIMMTREYQSGNPSNKFRIPAFIIALLFLGLVLFSILGTHWTITGSVLDNPDIQVATGNDIALKLFGTGGYALTIEIAGLLLLAAILGAIVLAKDKDK
jgi:NADH-quinone oxidoreductase subunit J